MKKNTVIIDTVIISVLVIITCGIILSIVFPNKKAENGTEKPLHYTDYAGKRIGVQTGTTFDDIIRLNIPDANICYYNTYTDMISAINSGTIDAFGVDEPVIRNIMAENNAMSYIEEFMDRYNYGFVFAKTKDGEELCSQLNDFLQEIKSDGTFKKINKLWFDSLEDERPVIDTDSLRGENGTVSLALESQFAPFVYVKDGKITGYEIDIAYRFCEKYGYKLDLKDMNFDAIIPAVDSGKCNFGCSGMSITDERKESMIFSEPDYTGGTVLAIKSNVLNKDEKGFFESIKLSFEKNFLRENRWKLIANGIGTTCLITFLSVVFGSLIGFSICIFRRTESRLANIISDIYVKILQGTPIVVLLMILFYVVFGNSGIDAVWVAVIGFSLNFGAYSSEIMRSGIQSIDGGQREAALALGYSERQAFFRFIFPQAAVRFLPIYKGEIISLLKNTSIVGYIAIEDITKMSDIIRSRTYEAFFPLIATAIIYFLLAWFISAVLGFIMKKADPKSRKHFTKGDVKNADDKN